MVGKTKMLIGLFLIMCRIKPLGRPRHGCEDNIEIDTRGLEWEHGGIFRLYGNKEFLYQ